ncbi:MAG: septum formation initiator family protein [Firmicutes bacterium]|nr:septum formation initiator family protein [Bacillota bacterium]
MAKKGSRLREFEKNHRVLDITSAQKERQKKKSSRKPQEEKKEDIANKKKRRVSWVRVIGLAVCAVFLLVVGISVKNIYDLKEREADLQKENQKLEQIKEELTVELENVNTDEYIEEKARRELKLIRPNELVFYFPDDFRLQQDEEESEE